MSQYRTLKELAKQSIVLLDGAMGTMIQQSALTNEDFRLNAEISAPGCNEILNLSRPDLIYEIHLAYLEAGCHILETNTFGANTVSLQEYGLTDLQYELNRSAVEIALAAIEAYREHSDSRPLFVAGVMGPTSKAASFSSDVEDPTFRELDFAAFVDLYEQQASALLEGGVDILLIETVFDALVAKAALLGAQKSMNKLNKSVPIMVSATFSDASRRTLGGQTVEAFVDTMASFNLFSLGLNCSTGAKEMIPLIRELSKSSPFLLSAHPNAGFPDQNGLYQQSPQALRSLLEPLMQEGLLNIVGGCCGTTAAHIAALSQAAAKYTPRALLPKESRLRLSGLESLHKEGLIIVGERTNVAGSRRFARLVRERKDDELLHIARSQVAAGAQMLDICVDDPLLDAPIEMVRLIRLFSSDPAIASVPFMLDSSDWAVIEKGLQELQGRGVVNSISLKEGEKLFVQKAKHIASMGAAMVVMLFDEKGQADTFERKIEIAQRVWDLLVTSKVCDSSSIIVDANVLSIATGLDEHDGYAKSFIDALAWMKTHLIGVNTSAGVSNLSFSFRGNDSFREAIHAIFLQYAVQAGLDMALVHPGSLIEPDTLDPQMRKVITRAILAQGDVKKSRTELIQWAQKSGKKEASTPVKEQQWRLLSPEKRVTHALIVGENSYLAQDLKELETTAAVELIEGPLMEGMAQVGSLFAKGELFLPHVVRSARVMKQAVDILSPRLHEDQKRGTKAGTIVLATVQGDVHDIGKNIVSLVLQCNNLEVIDAGVMVPASQILKLAQQHKADLVGLSALITPSLKEMAQVCTLFEQNGMKIPILIGGATTSVEHTARKLEPCYPKKVFHATDASSAVVAALNLLSANRATYKESVQQAYRFFTDAPTAKENLLTLNLAREKRFVKHEPAPVAKAYGIHQIEDVALTELIPLINWPMLCRFWRVPHSSEEGVRLISDAKKLLAQPHIMKVFNSSIKAVVGLFEARRSGFESIEVLAPQKMEFHFLRSQRADQSGLCRSLADYIHPEKTDTIGFFAATSALELQPLLHKYTQANDEYSALLVQSLADRLVEALSHYLHHYLQNSLWGFGNVPSIRPAIGYPSDPDHRHKESLFALLDVQKRTGIQLNSSFAMSPSASVCGYYFVGQGCDYFSLGELEEEQKELYAQKQGLDVAQLAFEEV